MKKNLTELLRDEKTHAEDIITNDMTLGADAGVDLDALAARTLEKSGIKAKIAPKPSFFRRYYRQVSALAACLAIVGGVTVAYRIWGGGAGIDVPSTDEAGNTTAAGTLGNIIWGEEIDSDREETPGETNGGANPNVPEGVYGDDDSPTVDAEIDGSGDPVDDVVLEYTEWNGVQISTYLADKLYSGSETDVYAIRVENGSLVIPDDYVFEGQTYGELKRLRSKYYEQAGKLWEAFKAGYGLIYGEDSYISGTPDGKWTEKYYNEMLDEYGEQYKAIYDRFEEMLKDKENLSTPPEADFGLYWGKYGEAAAEELYRDLIDEQNFVQSKIIRMREQYYAENRVDFSEGSEFYEIAKANGVKVYYTGTGSSFSYIFCSMPQLETLAKELAEKNLLYILASREEFRYYFNDDGTPVNHDTTGPSVTDAPVDFEDEIQIPSDDVFTDCYEWDTDVGYDPMPEPDTAEPIEK